MISEQTKIWMMIWWILYLFIYWAHVTWTPPRQMHCRVTCCVQCQWLRSSAWRLFWILTLLCSMHVHPFWLMSFQCILIWLAFQHFSTLYIKNYVTTLRVRMKVDLTKLYIVFRHIVNSSLNHDESKNFYAVN